MRTRQKYEASRLFLFAKDCSDRSGGESIRKRHIIPKQQDTDGSHTSGRDRKEAKRQQTYTTSSRSKIGFLLAEVLPVVLILTVPLSVHAGVFTSLVGALKKDTIIYERDIGDEAPQDLALLSATTNADPNGALGGGDVIIDEGALVSSGTIGEDEFAEKATFSGEISVYVVREGDTLSQIAEMFDVTANTILWANDIDNGVIQPGQSLVILPIVGVRHIVKDGDTMSSIAKKYDADVDEILDYNQLASVGSLSVGETLVIPGGEIAAPVRTSSAPSVARSAGGSSAGFTHPAPGAIRTQGVHGYNGVDLAGGHGSAIRAAAAGEVIVAKPSGWNGGYGIYAVIRHSDGTQTLYAHMSSLNVSVGTYVSAGEVIGGMGNTGRSTGTHLHFEVRGARNPF